MTHYLGITIGPIHHTIRQARKTRELWASSYIFSSLMKFLLKALDNNGLIQNNGNLEEITKTGILLSPSVSISENKNGVGAYPDRCFVQLSEAINAETLNQVIKDTLSDIRGLLPNFSGDTDELRKHFRILAAQYTVAETDTKSPLLKLNNHLDALEMQGFMPPKSSGKLVAILDDNIQTLYRDGGENDRFIQYDKGRKRLPTLLEIACLELKTEENSKIFQEKLENPINQAILDYENGQKGRSDGEAESQENAVVALKSALGTEFRFRHKYVCFIKADGDNIGEIIKNLNKDVEKIRAFSDTLGKFAQAATKKIICYGALPVYAGGDDLLFVAPVQKTKDENIFDLLNDLDNITKKDSGLNFSLSFGVSIGYYKYPMLEAIDVMDDLLFNQAKQSNGKNAIAFRVLKHSGQGFQTVLSKSGNAYKSFCNLLHACNHTNDIAFLTSVMHKIMELKPFLVQALQDNTTENFFFNNFNEMDHAPIPIKNYIESVRKFCEAAWAEYPINNSKTDSECPSGSSKPDVVVNQIFSALRFVQFLTQEDHD